MSTQTRIADRLRAGIGHPLDPLRSDEYAAAVSALRARNEVTERTRFVDITLREPSKESLMKLDPTSPAPPREASVVMLDVGDSAVYEATVRLADGGTEVVTFRTVTGVQPAITPEECADCEHAVRSDPAFRKALERRGITDMDLVLVEAWGIGDLANDGDGGQRLVWCPCWIRSYKGDNPYAHPIEGVYPIVDLTQMRVLRVEDHGVIVVPTESGDFRAEVMAAMRDDLQPLDIVQEKPSFEVDGWELRWQGWQLRVGFTQREGLVLHMIRYEDGGRLRPIIHRASIAELFVPYGDPSPGTFRRNAFDFGEYGAGRSTNSLELGCDCLGNIAYFDVDLCTSTGEPYTIRNAICVHEEDNGLLWKHSDSHTGGVEARRSRRLVISSILTVDNYDYGFYWYLYQEGSIEFEAKLTGIVLTSASASGATSPYGRMVAPQVIAPNHQHFLCARLDMCIDGIQNTVEELHTEAVPVGPDNQHGNGFVSRATQLDNELDARQLIDPLTARRWRVINPNQRNRFGDPVGYQLIPGENCLPFAAPDSSARRRAGFTNHHLWVTPFHPDERYPSGDYPNQSAGGAGLPEWTRANRPIDNTDLVVWYTFGTNHIVRPEEWPVMPIHRFGFALRPDGYFDRNPSLDVPPSMDHCNHD